MDELITHFKNTYILDYRCYEKMVEDAVKQFKYSKYECHNDNNDNNQNQTNLDFKSVERKEKDDNGEEKFYTPTNCEIENTKIEKVSKDREMKVNEEMSLNKDTE